MELDETYRMHNDSIRSKISCLRNSCIHYSHLRNSVQTITFITFIYKLNEKNLFIYLKIFISFKKNLKKKNSNLKRMLLRIFFLRIKTDKINFFFNKQKMITITKFNEIDEQ